MIPGYDEWKTATPPEFDEAPEPTEHDELEASLRADRDELERDRIHNPVDDDVRF